MVYLLFGPSSPTDTNSYDVLLGTIEIFLLRHPIKAGMV